MHARRRHRVPRRGGDDRGAIDEGLGILFGGMAILAFVLLLAEAVAFWHAHNVLEEAAAEGARVAAAFDGTCTQGTASAHAAIHQRAGRWAAAATVTCTISADGEVTVTVASTTPGVLFSAVGLQVRVAESSPRER